MPDITPAPDAATPVPDITPMPDDVVTPVPDVTPAPDVTPSPAPTSSIPIRIEPRKRSSHHPFLQTKIQ